MNRHPYPMDGLWYLGNDGRLLPLRFDPPWRTAMHKYDALKTRLRLESETGQAAADAIETLERDNDTAWAEAARLQSLADERGKRIDVLETALQQAEEARVRALIGTGE